MLGKLHCSQTEVTWALALPSEMTTGVWAGAGRWRERTGFQTWFCQSEGRALLPSLLHGSFVSRSPTEEASSKWQGWGQSPPAQRQLSTGCVTAVMLFHSNKRRRQMTWGWCSPASGLIGPSSGLNAEVSWQREAEEPDFPIPHSGSTASAGKRQALRSKERQKGPLALLLQVPPAWSRPVPHPRLWSWDEFCSFCTGGWQVAIICIDFVCVSAGTCAPA